MQKSASKVKMEGGTDYGCFKVKDETKTESGNSVSHGTNDKEGQKPGEDNTGKIDGDVINNGKTVLNNTAATRFTKRL